MEPNVDGQRAAVDEGGGLSYAGAVTPQEFQRLDRGLPDDANPRIPRLGEEPTFAGPPLTSATPSAASAAQATLTTPPPRRCKMCER